MKWLLLPVTQSLRFLGSNYAHRDERHHRAGATVAA
jgi:hypothetical protein